MASARPQRATVVLATTALLLTSCARAPARSVPEQDPREMVMAAFKQMQELESVRTRGTLRTPEGMIGLDLRTHVEGRCAGEVEVGLGSAQILHDGQRTWIKGDEEFWEASADTPLQARRMWTLVGSKWAKVPPNDKLQQFCSVGGLLESFASTKVDDGGFYSSGDVEEVGEVEATPVREKSGGVWTTVWVSVSEPHRVVKISTPSSPSPGTFYFDEFDHEFTTTAPDDEDVVDLTAVGGRSV